MEASGCTLWDVEYVKEAGEWFLRVYIDKAGGVSIDDCEAVSRPLSDALDEAAPIRGATPSRCPPPGWTGPLRRPEHFAQCMGQQVDVRFYRPVDGQKGYTGVLSGYEDGDCDGGRAALPQGGCRRCDCM